MKITVVNWSKYNPESSRTRHPYWFRLNRDIGLCPKINKMNDRQFRIWTMLLSECCRQNSGTIEIHLEILSMLCKCKTKDISQAIDFFEELGSINKTTTEKLNKVVQCTEHTLHYTTLHNKLHRAPKTEPTQIEDVFDNYPKRPNLRKSVALRKLSKLLKSPEEVNQFKIAVARYRDYVTKSQKKPEFIKQATTFVGEWRDWVVDSMPSQEYIDFRTGERKKT